MVWQQAATGLMVALAAALLLRRLSWFSGRGESGCGGCGGCSRVGPGQAPLPLVQLGSGTGMSAGTGRQPKD